MRARLGGLSLAPVIGHGDWESQNLRWHGRDPWVVHDWDSVVAQPEAECEERSIFLPQDESSAWAWLPLGARDTVAVRAVRTGAGGAEPGIRFAFGAPDAGVSGFCRTHRQALGAHAVALAADPSGQLMTSFGEVAPLALLASQWLGATVLRQVGEPRP